MFESGMDHFHLPTDELYSDAKQKNTTAIYWEYISRHKWKPDAGWLSYSVLWFDILGHGGSYERNGLTRI